MMCLVGACRFITLVGQELYDEGVKEGEMLGEMKKAKRSALLLSKKGTALSDIAEVLEVGIDIVQEWLSEVVYE